MNVLHQWVVADGIVEVSPTEAIILWIVYCYELKSGSSVPGLSEVWKFISFGGSFKQGDEGHTLRDKHSILPGFGENSTDILMLWIVVGRIVGETIPTSLSVAYRPNHIFVTSS
jgi:hypothetical protein